MSSDSTYYVEYDRPPHAAGDADVLPPRRAVPHYATRTANRHTNPGNGGKNNRGHHHHTRSCTTGSEKSSRSSASNQNTLFSFHRGKRIFNREIAFVMLVVAAQTMAELGAIGAGVLSTEVMADAYGFAERPSVDGDGYQHEFCYNSYTTTMPGGKFISFVDPMDGILTPSTSDGGDCDDEDEKDTPTEEDLEVLSLLSHRHRRNAFLQDDELWDRVMSFLPWRELMETRRVSRLMLRRSLSFAAVLRMPHTKHPALFIPCREDLDVDEAAAEAALSSSTASPQEPWLCDNCGSYNDSGRSSCLTNWCGMTRPPPSCRMFLGQLRRNGTVRMVEWLVNYVFDAPRGALVSVENHRNANTGRGKGCAWPTIADDATVNRLLLAHHRLFYDRVGGVEGVWLVPHGLEGVLQAETDNPARGGRNHLKYMPRNLMVFELPSGQQHHTAAPAPYHAVSTSTATVPYWVADHVQPPPLPPFQRPIPRSHQQQLPSLASVTLEASAGCSDRALDESNRMDSLPHSSDASGFGAATSGIEAPFVPHYDAASGKLFVRPGVYRHYPYAPLTFQL